MWKDIQIELGVRLKEIIPNAEQVFFMKTGSDATSGAVRLARCFTNRDLVLRWGYNGWHDWATPRPMGVPDVIQKDVYKFSYRPYWIYCSIRNRICKIHWDRTRIAG